MTDTRHLILLASVLALTGCGSATPLTTASLMGGNSPPPAAAAPVNDPQSRAIQVGATSGRATRCGFYFDAAKLKANFMAAEMAQGSSPEQLQRTEREYDHIRAAVIKAAASDAEYCSSSKTKEIETDLNRHLAGDFTPSAKPVKKEAGGFDLFGGSEETKPWRADKVFDEQYKRENRM
jgi:hypothetical protein